MSEPPPEPFEPELPPTRIIVARVVISLLLVTWAAFGLFGPVSITDARGTEEFYAGGRQHRETTAGRHRHRPQYLPAGVRATVNRQLARGGLHLAQILNAIWP